MLKDLFYKKRHYATLGQQQAPGKAMPTGKEPPKDNIPKGLVNKCNECGSLLIARELQKNLHTCPNCGYHFSVDAHTRFAYTFDGGTYVELDKSVTSTDPLPFPGYPAKIAQAQDATGLQEGAVTAEGTIEGFAVIVGVMDSRFIMGSMGSAMGEKLTRAMERALETRTPFVLFTASGGARMQEAILSLMQMAKTSVALERLHEAGVLFITVITHPTTGGVSASFASLGDVILAEPGALFGFAGRRVIEQTIRQKLPDDFQTAEFMLKHGMIDEVVNRKDMRQTLATLLKVHGARGWEHAE